MKARITAALLLSCLTGTASATDLSLKRVMLSSGGVGYFEYAANVEGDDTLTLDVPLAQVDDILKSLVVFDAAGGVAGVELPGRDTTIQAFGDAPFGPEALESPAAYLNALRGTEVTIQGPRPMTGRLLRAEPITEAVGTTTTQRTRVTLLGAEGMRQFVLEDADTVQISDPALRARIARALDALRQDASQATRHLSVRVKGQGKRTVAVGYVAGAPLWKATYRLILPAGTSSTARLQGWATLENQSGADWKDVSLTLVYGNPVAFRQALYRSYFVQRPEVPVEILGQVLPDIDTRARDMAPSPPSVAPAPAPLAPMRGAAVRSMVPAAPPVIMAAPVETADASETAEETIFALTRTVVLAAGHSANVPIIDREFPAPRVGLVPFGKTHPLAAVRLRNDDQRGLPAGVLTLYDIASGTASFAGDARLGGLPAGETRLLSFAQDLRTSIETSQTGRPNTIVAFSVADGVLAYTVRTRTAVRIAMAAPAREARDLLLEIPRSNPAQTLLLEDGKTGPSEQTATAFRIAVSLAAGETKTVTAWLDQPVRQTVALVDGDEAALRLIVGEDQLNAPGRAALGRVLELRRDEARKQAEVVRLTKQMNEIRENEDRLRKNLAAVTSADPLRARMTRALDADETKIEQVQKAIADAMAEVEKAHRAVVEAVTAMRL